MNKFLKKILMAGVGIAFVAGSSLPNVFAESVSVSLPTFKITMNDVRIENSERLYPIILYKDITYVPMTYNDSRFLGLETKWSADTGLQVNKISVQTPYNPNKGYLNSNLESATLPDFKISVNGKDIDNNSETYPLLVFRDITYFPLTWRYMVDAFGWTSDYDPAKGLVISSKAGSTGTTAPVVNEKVFSRDFGSTTVFFDRASNKQPGNLYVKENNRTRQIGNPNYIYGVGYLQAGTYGEYTAVDKMEYANRWVYTLAVDPSAYPVTSKNVRINIDTNEVQAVDGSDVGSNSNQFYSRQFNNVTVMIDRASTNQPGNLYVKENNNTKKIGNPNYIYGVNALQNGGYTAVNQVEYANRWVYTLAADPSASPVTSRNVKINIDTNEVQTVDGSSISDNSPISNQVYSRQFNNITVLLDRASNKQPGNLYVKENNITKKIGDPKYIYGVSYINLLGFESYSPVNNVSVSDRWVYTLAIDTSAASLVSKSVRVNIDTNEVQLSN
ncbi:MAG TPA: hypothetical protein VN631_03030 [Negativicutes bacterium]|nr:hypothetical protein [Negativicutes bacterium]